MKLCVLSMLTLVVVTTTTVQAQDLPALPRPTQEHQWLHQFVGEWSTQSKADFGPGQPAMECEGAIRSRMIGGFWVVNEMTGDMAGTPMVGIQTIGYDPATKKYVGTWVDSMVNHMWHYEGTVDATGKILTLEAEGPNFMAEGKLAKFQDVYEFKSANEMVITSRMQGEEKQWTTFMRGMAKRKENGTK